MQRLYLWFPKTYDFFPASDTATKIAVLILSLIHISIPVITDFTDADGNDRMKEMIQENYNRIKAEVRQIVADELQRIMSACSSFGSDWHSLQMCSACPLPEKLSLDLWQPHTLQ